VETIAEYLRLRLDFIQKDEAFSTAMKSLNPKIHDTISNTKPQQK